MIFDRARYRRERMDRMAAERLDVLEETCSVKGCAKLSSDTFTGPFGDRSFCRVHAPAYYTHYRIIRDILKL